MAGWDGGAVPIGSSPAGAASGTTVLDAVGPLSYTSVTPYRTVATPSLGPERLTSGYYLAGPVWSDQDGNQQMPSGIKAVTFNLTVTQTLGAGFLAVIPADAVFAGVSTINWTARNVDRANNGTVGVGPLGDGTPGCVAVLCFGPAAATHFIIDLTGYFI
jgi:hypothetical protein